METLPDTLPIASGPACLMCGILVDAYMAEHGVDWLSMLAVDWFTGKAQIKLCFMLADAGFVPGQGE